MPHKYLTQIMDEEQILLFHIKLTPEKVIFIQLKVVHLCYSIRHYEENAKGSSKVTLEYLYFFICLIPACKLIR